MDTSHVILTQLEVSGCSAELWLNGIPVTRIGPRSVPFESRAAQQFLVAGTNQLEILIEPGSAPSRARMDKREAELPGAYVIGRLSRFPDGSPAEPDLGERLIEVIWRADQGKTEVFPRSLIERAELGPIVPRFPYEDAPVLTLDDSLIDEADAVLQEIAGAFRRGSAAEMLALLEDQGRDALAAYPAVSEDAVRQNIAETVALYHRSKEPVKALRRERHDFRLVAFGRMLECLDDDYLPSLRLVDPDDGSVVPYPIFLSRLGGRLRVVR